LKLTRRFRKKLTVECLHLGQVLAQKGGVRTIEAMRKGLRIFTRTALPLRLRLKKNMQLAGVYRDGPDDFNGTRNPWQFLLERLRG
jgi:hypothetical protein